MKRIAAIVLPEIACELALMRGLVSGSHPFAVIVDDEPSGEDGSSPSMSAAVDSSSMDRSAILDAVSHEAWSYGARPGQSAAQAAAVVGKMRVVRLARAELMSALGAVAEIALAFGTTAALELRSGDSGASLASGRSYYPLGSGAGPLDTVWLDISGCARRMGGEEVLVAELRERIAALGHRARVAIGDGPRIAQAMARWAQPRQGRPELIQLPGAAAEELRPLPVAALPLSVDVSRWLIKLGVLRVEDLTRLDRASLSHRLGPNARDLLGLVAGHDDLPLSPYQPPRRIIESTSFEDEVGSTEPLLFVLRGLTSRALARLTCRGEACTRASILLSFDRSVIALENRARRQQQLLPPEMQLDLELPLALSGEEDLLRALHAKLERLELSAPVTAISLILDGLTAQPHHQLDMGRQRGADPNALPTLLAELDAWLGPGHVGTLEQVDSHRPEARSILVPVDLSARKKAPHTVDPLSPVLLPEPTRILPEPILVGRLATGSLISAATNLYLVDRLRLSARIDRVEWWSPSPISRDYARAWLRTNVREASHRSARVVQEHAEHGEAWMFVDRSNGRGYLHGWYE